MTLKLLKSMVALSILTTTMVHAAAIRIMFFTTANNTPIGYINARDTKNGLLLKPMLSGLTPGMHGLHVHQNPACDKQGEAAGPHFDPNKTNHHQGPYDAGHRGDLPALYVNAQGMATVPTLAPHLTVQDLHDHSIIVHSGADNYSDTPQPNGGGGARFACGIVK